MRVTILLVALMALVGSWLSAAPAAAQSADPAAAVRAHYVAWNRIDWPAVVATFAEDATINDNGTLYVGREQIAPWVARFLTTSENIALSNVWVDGQRVGWDWTRHGDAARMRIGVPFTRGEGEALIARDGLITYFAIRSDRAATPQLEAAYRSAVNKAFAAQVTQVAQREREAAAAAALPERSTPTAGRLVAAGVVAVTCLALYAGLKRPAGAH